MLITFTCHAPNAAEIGYLLGKHPQSVFEREFSAGKVWVFYPEVADDRLTVAMLTEVDPVGLVRGPANSATLDQYVNDRPYVASSLTSVALKTAFSAAMGGKAKTHAERYTEPMRWEITLPAVACEAGEAMITRLFAPLGYSVTTTRLPLDPMFPAWGQADLYSLSLEGTQTVPDVFSHLYVLLPVLDNSKHYYIDATEIEKLLEHGGDWLAAHPERELIARRYLRYKQQFIASALARLMESEEVAPSVAEAAIEEIAEAAQDMPAEEAAEAAQKTQASQVSQVSQASEGMDASAPAEKALGLHEQRLKAVMTAIEEIGARSLVDLGCGEGRLLRLALKNRSLERMLGIDVSMQALALASRRLRLEKMPPAERKRIELAHGSLLYRDRRLEGFDVAALVEVVEHLDPPRLGAMERVVFEHARPRRVIVTTPNREYNARWEALGERLRHSDHRFEWTRAECQSWAERVAAMYRYRFNWQEVGPADPALGAPSQLVIFDRLDGTDETAVQEVTHE
jgi:2-polyprenyl-3-methyl-5-hydroxy-6-metoxy-1,4-benzoquinol methylase